ncbi:MAG: hypothetical protein RLZ68_182 [Pseudomonadota bacterium]|jgi:hypothetical protein
MFFTKEFQRNPLSAILGEQDTTYWTSFELGLMTPWYVILLMQPMRDEESPIEDDAPTINRTIVVGDIHDVLGLLSTQHQSEVKVQSAYIVFPNREAPEVNWEMKKIRAAWTSKKNAQEDDLMSSPVDYVESEDGKMYPMLHQPSAPKSKKGYRMICAFP